MFLYTLPVTTHFLQGTFVLSSRGLQVPAINNLTFFFLSFSTTPHIPSPFSTKQNTRGRGLKKNPHPHPTPLWGGDFFRAGIHTPVLFFFFSQKMLQFATVLLLLCAGVTVVGLTSEEEAEVQALRDEVKRLQEELRTLNRTALPPSPPPRTQAVLEEVELAFLNAQQSRPTSYFLSPRKDSSPIPGFARYQAESSGVNEVTAASTLSREGITLQEDSKALCFFYATPTACDRDPLCQWGSSDTIGEKCGPRAVECSAIATTVSQCVGPNSEFENDCAWSCSCEKKTHSNTEEGGHSTAEQLCSCPKLEDNPFHIHSKVCLFFFPPLPISPPPEIFGSFAGNNNTNQIPLNSRQSDISLQNYELRLGK